MDFLISWKKYVSAKRACQKMQSEMSVHLAPVLSLIGQAIGLSMGYADISG